MPILLTEADVKALLTMDDLIPAMGDALAEFSARQVTQPLRTVLDVGEQHAFYGVMPAYMPGTPALGTKLVTVFSGNPARGLTDPSRHHRAAGSRDRRAAGADGRTLHHRSANRRGVGGVGAAPRARGCRASSRSSAPACRRAAISRRSPGPPAEGRPRLEPHTCQRRHLRRARCSHTSTAHSARLDSAEGRGARCRHRRARPPRRRSRSSTASGSRTGRTSAPSARAARQSARWKAPWSHAPISTSIPGKRRWRKPATSFCRSRRALSTRVISRPSWAKLPAG